MTAPEFPKQRYGYAVMFLDGEDMGDYVGYFQDTIESARSVADEIMFNSDQVAGIGIYELKYLETVEPEPPEDDDDDS